MARGQLELPGSRMNLRYLREVDSALVGMVFLMRRVVTTKDDGSYAYAGRTDFALLSRPNRGRAAPLPPARRGTPS